MSSIDTIAYAKAGRIFTATNVSVKIVTVVGTAMTGLILNNPVGSGKYLAFMSAGYSMTTAVGSIFSLGIAITPTTTIIPSSLTVGGATIASATGGTSASVGQTWDTATLGAACVARRWFAGQDWITGGSGQAPYQFESKIDGELGLMPGAAAAFCMIGGTGPSGLGSISYIEVDL